MAENGTIPPNLLSLLEETFLKISRLFFWQHLEFKNAQPAVRLILFFLIVFHMGCVV